MIKRAILRLSSKYLKRFAIEKLPYIAHAHILKILRQLNWSDDEDNPCVDFLLTCDISDKGMDYEFDLLDDELQKITKSAKAPSRLR